MLKVLVWFRFRFVFIERHILLSRLQSTLISLMAAFRLSLSSSRTKIFKNYLHLSIEAWQRWRERSCWLKPNWLLMFTGYFHFMNVCVCMCMCVLQFFRSNRMNWWGICITVTKETIEYFSNRKQWLYTYNRLHVHGQRKKNGIKLFTKIDWQYFCDKLHWVKRKLLRFSRTYKIHIWLIYL